MDYDAVVIGSGVNGLCAAITLAQAGRKVLIREGAATLGGSCRSAELTLPGFMHDVCATVQALAVVSPFIKSLPLKEHGLQLMQPQAAFAQPMDDGSAAVVYPSIDATAQTLQSDGPAWKRRMGSLLEQWDRLAPELLAPLHVPRHPVTMARFGFHAMRSAQGLARSWFRTPGAQALFAGAAAHATLPLEWPGTAAMGLVLALSAHAVGWPVARGGSQNLVNALASLFRSLGGIIEVNAPVGNVDEFKKDQVILCDITPRQLLRVAGHRFAETYRRRLQRYQYGPGSWKVDYALDGPIPWKSPQCGEAGTLHLGGTLEEIAAAERGAWKGEHAEKPYVLLVQSSLFDPTRAPAGKHTVWAYCHVPHGSNLDMTSRIESQIERFAPGFRDRILARHVMGPAALERHNPNLVGGDISGGAVHLGQLFTRPLARFDPYSTPVKGLYLCSASTPPGPGVHGMCGHFAARSALRYMAPFSPAHTKNREQL